MKLGTVVAVALAIVVAVGADRSLALHGDTGSRARVSGSATGAAYGPAGLAVYEEQSPHVASRLATYGAAGGVQGAPTTPTATLPPVPASAFGIPISQYKAFSGRQLVLMQGAISRLEQALAGGNRDGAQAAWRAAFSD